MVGQINLMANYLQVRNQRPISPNQKKKKKLIKQTEIQHHKEKVSNIKIF